MVNLSHYQILKVHSGSTQEILQVSNNVMIKVEGRFRITAKAVPITQEESQIHNYGITEEDKIPLLI